MIEVITPTKSPDRDLSLDGERLLIYIYYCNELGLHVRSNVNTLDMSNERYTAARDELIARGYIHPS